MSRRIRRTAGLVFLVLGSLLLLSVTLLQAYAYYVNWQMSHVVELPDPSVAVESAATGSLIEAVHSPRPLLPPTHIRIPSVALDAKVVEVGIRIDKGQPVWEVPAHAVGHYRTSALPGEGSNIVMAGHISSPFEGSVFRRLPEVRVGDIVVVETEEAVFRYQVTSRDIVTPDAVQVMKPTPTETLTLLTCYPDLVFSHRLVLRAVPAQPAPDGKATPG